MSNKLLIPPNKHAFVRIVKAFQKDERLLLFINFVYTHKDFLASPLLSILSPLEQEWSS